MRVLGAVLLNAAVGCALTASFADIAYAEQAVVVVRPFEGRGSSMVRNAAVKALQGQSVSFVPSNEVDDAASDIGADPESAQGRVAISRELGITAWVVGRVERSGRGYVAHIEILNGEDGASLEGLSFRGRRPKAVAKRVARQLGSQAESSIASSRAPAAQQEVDEDLMLLDEGPDEAEPEPEPARPQRSAEMRDEVDDEAEEDDDDGDAASPLDVQVGLVGLSRSFDYNDDLSGLRTYSLPAAPAVGLRAHWYPAAHGSNEGVLPHIGLDLRGRFVFLVDSTFEGTSFPTSSHAFGVGLRGRIPLGRSELGFVAGYGNETFTIDAAETDDGEINPGIPATEYQLLRLGADGRIALGDKWALGLAAAYLAVLDSGELEEWFPNASVFGVEAQLDVIHNLSRSFELRVGVAMERFAYTLNPELEDVEQGRPIAGGALDQYLVGEFGARLVL